MSVSDADKEVHDELDTLKGHVREAYWMKGIRSEPDIIRALENEQYAVSPNELKQVLHELEAENIVTDSDKGGNASNQVVPVTPVTTETTGLATTPSAVPPILTTVTATVAPTPPVPLLMPPPITEIDDLIKAGYTVHQIEETLFSRYKARYRRIILERRKIAIRPPPATAPEQKLETTQEIGMAGNTSLQVNGTAVETQIASLKSEHGIDLIRGGSAVATPQVSTPQEQALKIKNFNAMLTAMKKTGQPFDPAMLAASLGFFDIAEQVRNATNQGTIQQLLQSYAAHGTPDNPTLLSTSVPGGTNLMSTIEAVLNKAFEMKVMSKVLGPILAGMDDKPSSGAAAPPDKYEIQRMMQEEFRKLQGDPEVRALKEQMTRLETNLSGGGKNNPELAVMQFKLESLQADKNRESNNEQLKMFKELTQSTGGNVTALTEKLQQIQAENDRQREADRMRYDSDLRAMQQREREVYMDRLKDVEARLDKAISGGGTNSMLEQYQATRTLVREEMKELDSLRGKEGGGVNIPELLSSTLKEFAPAVTAYAQARAGVPPSPPPAGGRQGVQTAMVTGQCPWCLRNVTIPDLDNVPCPECGKMIQPHAGGGPTGAPTAPSPPASMTGGAPTIPMGQPSMSPMVPEVAPLPVYDSPVQNGQIVRPRNPNEVVIA